MKVIPSALSHVGAFAAKPFEGNPAAMCPLNGLLDDDRLPQVAAENNLSETAFFVAREAYYGLRMVHSPQRGEIMRARRLRCRAGC